MIRNLVVFVFFLLLVLKITLAVIYSDQWAVHIEGNDYDANRIASKYGFINLGQILPGYYHFVHRKVAKRSLEPNSEHHAKLSLEPQVRWAKQQTVRKRVKRDFRGIQLQKTKLNDPRWPQMWYLNRGEGLDMNVQKAWVQGITGKGVVVTILDDGLEKDHPDIKRNYSPKASYDVNNHDEDPQPRYDSIDSNRHGTRCAGEVAANANNSICAVGVAYDASIGGVRMLDGDVTDAVEARSLSLNPQHIAIYSASWGPDDDGKTVDGPGELATRAFKEGITHGRNGFGSIFVWASGNGGRDHDNCNCDGYTNSIWTLSISSATENGLVPWYSEACSSTLATTYSSGSSSEKQVITTDLHHGCTSSHTGTSASAPLAAGICALALQVNSKLTWRDMQHIVVRSARPANLRAPDWATNGIGRNVSHSFGYGLMDASAMVEYARNWTTVPEQKTCYVRTPQRDKLIPAKSEVKLQVNVDCPEVKYLEHVQAKISLAATRRGDIHIFLISPMGTRSTLLAIRPHDNSRSGFQAWPFMTVHCWGENPTGVWTLEIHNEGRYQGRATLGEWHLIFYGTTEDPDHQVHSTDSSSSTSSSTTSSTTSISKITTTSAAAAAAAAITTTTTTSTITNNNIPYPVPQPFPSMPSVYPGDNSVLHDDRSGSHPDQAAKQTLQNGAASISDWHLIHYGTKESPDSGSVKDQPLSSVESSACKQTNASRACLDCPDGYHQEGSKCVITCQPQTYLVSDNLQKKQYCQPCHYTCFNCSGPNDYQCTSCFGDAVLDSGYCQPLRFYSELKDTKKWYTALTVMFIIFAIIIVVLIICLINKDKKHYFAKNIKKFKYFSMPQMDHSSPNTIDSAEEM